MITYRKTGRANYMWYNAASLVMTEYEGVMPQGRCIRVSYSA